ncbi:MAG: hypothetical protein HYT87_16595 [Nitrospirae bacterium]|nr:hypothetical protein [Nitrospirota bacterium]
MRNGKPTLRKLRAEMLDRFDLMERNFCRQLLEMKKTFGRDIRGLKEKVKDVIEFIADMDQELKDHKRDSRAHQ